MKRYLLVLSVVLAVAVAVLAVRLGEERAEAERLGNNQRALMRQVETYRNRMGGSVASVEALTLTVEELRRGRDEALRTVESLNVKLRHMESLSATAVQSGIAVTAPLRDSLVFHPVEGAAAMADTCCVAGERVGSRPDSVKAFSWRDGWASVDGIVAGDSVTCTLRHVDTLVQVVHRVPRRFLCFRYGVKAIRQEVVAKSPHSRIVYTEYIELK